MKGKVEGRVEGPGATGAEGEERKRVWLWTLLGRGGRNQPLTGREEEELLGFW